MLINSQTRERWKNVKSTSKRSSGAVSKFLSDRCLFVMGSSRDCLSLPPPVAGSQFFILSCQGEVGRLQGQDTEPQEAGGQRRVMVMGVPSPSWDLHTAVAWVGRISIRGFSLPHSTMPWLQGIFLIPNPQSNTLKKGNMIFFSQEDAKTLRV